MAAIKVHGNPISTAAMRVVACLYEKDVDFEYVNVNLAAGEHKKPTFVALNPFGQIPAFEDGDLKLFESRAIAQYVSHKYADRGTRLISQEPKEMAITQVWMEVEAQHFEPAASALTFELVIKQMFGMVMDPAAVEAEEAKLGKVLDVYEARLAASKYLGGDAFSLADLNHLPNITYLMETRVNTLFTSRPNVSNWCKHILGRPAWCKVQAMRK